MSFWRSFSVLCLLFVSACSQAETYPLEIGKNRFAVEFADDDTERARGLMFRKSLADDAGMFFLFEGDEPRGFWMKNTLIPLDMIFIRSDGTIVNIYRNAQPHDETLIDSQFPARAVLEISGGQADKRGIHIGDKIKTELLK